MNPVVQLSRLTKPPQGEQRETPAFRQGLPSDLHQPQPLQRGFPQFIVQQQNPFPVGHRCDYVLIESLVGSQREADRRHRLERVPGALNEVLVAALELPVLGALAVAVPVVRAVVLAHLRGNNEAKGFRRVGGGLCHARMISRARSVVNYSRAYAHDKVNNLFHRDYSTTRFLVCQTSYRSHHRGT